MSAAISVCHYHLRYSDGPNPPESRSIRRGARPDTAGKWIARLEREKYSGLPRNHRMDVATSSTGPDALAHHRSTHRRQRASQCDRRSLIARSRALFLEQQRREIPRDSCRHTIHVCMPGVSISVCRTPFDFSHSRNLRFCSISRSSVPQAIHSSWIFLFRLVQIRKCLVVVVGLPTGAKCADPRELVHSVQPDITEIRRRPSTAPRSRACCDPWIRDTLLHPRHHFAEERVTIIIVVLLADARIPQTRAARSTISGAP